MAFLKNTIVSAGIATAGTTIAAVVLGWLEADHPAAPINATSHIVWGEAAAEQDGLSAGYTVVGTTLNAVAMLGWAALQELTMGRWARRGSPMRALAAGTATSTVAYATDYHIVPERLTPGFEKRLSPSALAITYGILALCLATGVRKGLD